MPDTREYLMSVDAAISDASTSLMFDEKKGGDWTKVQDLLAYYPEFKDLPKTGRLDFQTKDAIDIFYKTYFPASRFTLGPPPEGRRQILQRRADRPNEREARKIYLDKDIPLGEDSWTEDTILQGELNAMMPAMTGMESPPDKTAYSPAPPMSPPVDMDIRRSGDVFDILGLDPEEIDWLEGLDEYPDPMPLSGDR